MFTFVHRFWIPCKYSRHFQTLATSRLSLFSENMICKERQGHYREGHELPNFRVVKLVSDPLAYFLGLAANYYLPHLILLRIKQIIHLL